MTKGRFREFYQCDFDIAGEYDLMIPDAEALKLMTEILDEVNVGNYVIKLNHRQLLDGIFALCGVPTEKFRTICSAVDKLDKTPWDEVRKEMVSEKGLDPAVADNIEKFVRLNGKPFDLLNKILSEKLCDGNATAMKTLEDLRVLFDYLECYGITNKILFDLSLARGLDYYTGVIYEAVITDANQVGSIAAGGRYDNLVGIFGSPIPAVGFSVGVERIFAFLEASVQKESMRISETDVFVASIDKDLLKDRMKICSELWAAGIKAELLPKATPKIAAQLNFANQGNIPFAIIFGKSELDNGTVKLKNLVTSIQHEVKRSELVDVVKQKIVEYYQSNTTQNVSNSNKKVEEKEKQ